MKIKVGEYVRIKDVRCGTKIAKIEKLLGKDSCYRNMKMYAIDVTHQKSFGHYVKFIIYKEDILKHSPNIIDLIELGDYVNGKEVFINAKEYLIFKDVGSTVYSESISPENIKSIVTHEQMKEMEYKL